jgi:hypothetical protein
LTYFAAEPCGIVEALVRLRRMAQVLVAPVRTKIMLALGVRPTSPKMFQDEYGGGELSRIDDNFKKLERHNWIALFETRTGGKRRGGVEHLYRAVQIPIFDSSTWPVLPIAMREMYSWWVLATLTERAEDALVSETMEARTGRRHDCISGLADESAVHRVLGRTDDAFGFIQEELKASGARMVTSGGQPITLTAALAAFESPSGSLDPDRRLELHAKARALPTSIHSFPVRMAKAMLDPLRILILAELGTRPMSAKEFFEEFGGGEITRAKVYRAFKVLRNFDWLVLVETKGGGKRRGGKERFYRAARPPILDKASWPAFPDSVKDEAGARMFLPVATCIREAIEAGTMDSRTDRHFTWTPGVVDQLGWERIVKRMDDLFDFVRAELKRAEARLAKSGEKPIPMTVALAAFESPAASSRVH